MGIWKRMTAFEARGVSADLDCIGCGDSVETRVLPGETNSSRKSTCECCVDQLAHEKGLLD